MGPKGNNNNYPPWRTQIVTLLCPSDGAPTESFGRPQGDTNYAVNWGDNGAGVSDDNMPFAYPAMRGMFQVQRSLGLRDARDGTTNTLLFAEIGRNSGDNVYQGGILRNAAGLTFDDATGFANPSACVTAAANPTNPGRYPSGASVRQDRGAAWSISDAQMTGFTTILPPNGPSCGNGTEVWEDVMVSAGSYHSGGIQATLCDGSVRFISETIDTVTANRTSEANVTTGQSPYGVWGALGTRNGGEVVDEF